MSLSIKKVPSISSTPKGFSLIEVSIVIVIIGLLLAGVVGSKHLVQKARINSAQAMTRSSVVNGIPNNKLWIESSLAELFLGEELSTGDAITSWVDNSPNKTSISISSVGSGPTYSNSINNIQAVQFDANSDSNYLQINNAAFLNGTNYTIFIVEKRMATNSIVNNYLLGEAASFSIGYESGTSIIQSHSESSSVDNTANIESLSSYSNKPRVLSFTHSSTDGNEIFINATLANEDSTSNATTHLSSLTTLAIGKGYNGEIGEIVMFDRKLKSVERKEVENYLSDKWNSPNNRDSNTSCIAGTILSTGCDSSCSISINGSSDTNLASGLSANFLCDATGYNSGSTTQEYTCNDGTLSPSTPASSECYDDLGCDTGYLESSGSCVQGCLVSVIGSSLDSTTVVDGTAVTCDETGYDDSTAGTCSAPSGVSNTCGCDSGNSYTDSNADDICEAPCILSLGDTGLPSNVDVLSGTSSYNCSDAGSYNGTITYDACSNGSSLTSVSGACIEATVCAGGDDMDTTTVSGDVIHIFTTVGSATLVCDDAVTAQVLVVAGGGGGGDGSGTLGGGGGGGGGVVYSSSYPITAATYSVTVGDGGSKGSPGVNGTDSIFEDMTADGGGGGASNTVSPYIAKDGGSGGGSLMNSTTAVSTQSAQPNETNHYGTSGGGPYTSGHYGANGGGGGGGIGGTAVYISYRNLIGGAGGLGIENAITGSSGVYYSGGGGGSTGADGGGNSGPGGLGGSSVGGNGDHYTTNANAGNGIANTGGGGGGSTDKIAGNGGSGIVIIRYTNP